MAKRTSRQGSLTIPLVTAIAVGVIIIAAVLWGRSLTGSGSGTKSSAADFGHIHGLGVDPKSGDLYAGTHYGVFRMDESGKPNQVGPVRDYMGFTVKGPSHFLASGHPGIGESGPSSLGLIESTDGAKKWTTLSLAGQADFHALKVSGSRVYGFNNGTLMRSDDGKSWSTGASQPLRDIAIHPSNVDTLVATTSDGLVRSTDAGRTFAPVPDSPFMTLIAWPTETTMFGTFAGGQVQASTDGGKTWEQRGSVGGSPQAMTATADTLFVATDSAVLKSIDGGRTFSTITRTTE